MTLNLRSSLVLSTAGHALLLLLVWAAGASLRRMPTITEITLVSSNKPGGAPQGAAVQQAKPGGRRGTGHVKPTASVHKGQVSIATPEFVPIGKKPRRSGEELMGGDAGDGGGQPGPTMGGGTAGGAGRTVRYQEPLEYPEWAKEQGIDAKVVLRFKVFPNGSVDSQITVVKTSGWRQLDEEAIKSLRNYQFEPLPAGARQDVQFGELAFHFKPE